MLWVGFYFLKKNKSKEDYFVGGRSMTAGHIGLSVVATDVGGGFSIGLGGLGFTMGLSGSWMLFTGLIGAWLSAAILIPKVYPLARKHKFLTFPQILNHHYGKPVALAAGIISFIGYTGFCSSQILAGAKLFAATFHGFDIKTAAILMGIIAVVYTVSGGIKAVIYTDTIQWIILMGGLIFIGIPFTYSQLGSWENISQYIPESHWQLKNLQPVQFINWFITIVPIWFIGMSLYQRIYSCYDEKTAIKAWRIAGLFEWPIMAFMGVILGLFARAALEMGVFQSIGYPAGSAMDPELGLPLLLSSLLPVGLMGIMMAAYFSAIMSTADSCLMAASGNLSTDIINHFKKFQHLKSIRFNQWVTFIIGAIAVYIATEMESVLNLMLYSYAFMVSGMLVPVLAFIFIKKPSAKAALSSMLVGGSVTLMLILSNIQLPWGFDANLFGLSASAISFIIIHFFDKKNGRTHHSK